MTHKISRVVALIIIASIITVVWCGILVYATVLSPLPSSYLKPGEKAIRAIEVKPTTEITKWQVVKTGKLTAGYYQGELPADELVQYAVGHCDYYIKSNYTVFPVVHTGVYNNTKSYYVFHCVNATQHINAIDPATFRPVDVIPYVVTSPIVFGSWVAPCAVHFRQRKKESLVSH